MTFLPGLADGDGGIFSYEKLSLIGALVIAIIAFMRRWVVPGAFYDDLKKQVEDLQKANSDLRRVNQSATGTAEKLATQAPPEKRTPNEP